MISASLLRAIQCTEKLHCCPGKRLLLLQLVPFNKADIKTWPCLRWGLLGQREVVLQPRRILRVTQKAIWTQGYKPLRAEEDSSKQVSVQKSRRGEPALSISQRVKEAGKRFTYLIIVLIGIGGLFYVIFKELFSSSSPNKIFGKALEKCRSHPEVISVFGDNIKGYGESTRRGRRQHVSHIEYVKDGQKYMRLKFYIEGSVPGKQGTVHLETKENPESGIYEFRYIFVDVDVFPRRIIIIEDNRR
ncbi:LOW QUALITY PROTEIN: mitochondrial import inner membrane translocase subunit Tim21 [Dromiciops gliroides]|uniref:LOW QUALITY PROTEIN: mitochondrial import inner membrane translocase subunit Tim21 n=1 Tax=Dromiciops gliroides TaxID=33562 RepID=UPI001CC79F58|nr:LOW QUALITY PROTEIN: mitochondrial import inner membrane translocase subunit Tim21 [Dromiciops gliroides]